SAVNAMIYTRGVAWDYDQWAAAGNVGWGYRDMLAYFRRSEGFEDGPNEFHGGEGAYRVSHLRYNHPLNEKFLAAAEACGFPRNSDFNGPLQEGVGLYHVAQHDGSRCSNAHAFLHPIERRRSNLTVITGARATRILFEG